MSETRFNELLSGLLDGELSAEELAELAQLTRGVPACEREIRAQLETAELVALSEDALRDPALFLTAVQSRLSQDSLVRRVRSGIRMSRRPRVWRALNPWSLATAAAMALLGIGLFIWQSGRDAVIAQLASVSGAVEWTGNDGMVERSPAIGKALTGGTLETLGWDSSATVEFPDQTVVTLYGQSTVTLAAQDRKVFHLRAGNLEARVSPRPGGRELMVHTPAAALEVLGTRFNLTTDEEQTKLAVHQGRVRLVQRSDKSEVEVPAAHLAVASIAAERALAVVPMVTRTNDWAPKLAQAVDYGQWISALHAWRRELGRAVEAGEMTREDAERAWRTRAMHLPEDAGSVHARPAIFSEAGEVYYLVSLSATRGLHGPIRLAEGGRFRIQGRVQSPTVITLVISTIDPDGTSGSRFLTRRHAAGEFDVELRLEDFQPGGSRPSASPVRQQLVGWGCFTPDRAAGLTIGAVRLSGPE